MPNPLCSLNRGFGCFQISAMGHGASAGGAIPDGTAKKNPHLFLGDGKDAAPNPCLLTKGLPPARNRRRHIISLRKAHCMAHCHHIP